MCIFTADAADGHPDIYIHSWWSSKCVYSQLIGIQMCIFTADVDGHPDIYSQLVFIQMCIFTAGGHLNVYISSLWSSKLYIYSQWSSNMYIHSCLSYKSVHLQLMMINSWFSVRCN
ncbi:unnamed protein product [Owenia fusiformis]|uniref:Uncharacterized protein n=1 Tax=Owenia fusiformis TaxID=6347 RepID=A0A8J1Y541_OWEFU|nr:unnamed protein product [Owenia fusiformis]